MIDAAIKGEGPRKDEGLAEESSEFEQKEGDC